MIGVSWGSWHKPHYDGARLPGVDAVYSDIVSLEHKHVC